VDKSDLLPMCRRPERQKCAIRLYSKTENHEEENDAFLWQEHALTASAASSDVFAVRHAQPQTALGRSLVWRQAQHVQ
jgi:hypothetical protein